MKRSIKRLQAFILALVMILACIGVVPKKVYAAINASQVDIFSGTYVSGQVFVLNVGSLPSGCQQDTAISYNGKTMTAKEYWLLRIDELLAQASASNVNNVVISSVILNNYTGQYINQLLDKLSDRVSVTQLDVNIAGYTQEVLSDIEWRDVTRINLAYPVRSQYLRLFLNNDYFWCSANQIYSGEPDGYEAGTYYRISRFGAISYTSNIEFPYSNLVSGGSTSYVQVYEDGYIAHWRKVGYRANLHYTFTSPVNGTLLNQYVEEHAPNDIYAANRYQGWGNLGLHIEWVPLPVNVNAYNDNTSLVFSNKITFDTAYTLPTLTKTGYTHSGWYETQGLVSGTVPIAGTWQYMDANMNTLSVNLKPVWTPNNYTVTYDANGGTVSPASQVVAYDSSLTLPTPTRAGYSFSHWNWGTNVGQLANPMTYSIAGNATFTANWIPNQYNINYSTNGGTVSSPTTVATFDQNVTLLTPTKDGYDFVGWYYGSTKLDQTFKYTYPQTITVTAKWEEKSYKINLDANGGEVSQEYTTTKYNQAFGNIPTPTRAGYLFKGWYDDDTLVEADTIFTYKEDITVKAKWEPKEIHFTLDANGGTCDLTELSAFYDNSMGELPTPIRTGYNFVGWYNALENGTLATSNGINKFPEDTILYAIWEAKEYTVMMDTRTVNKYHKSVTYDDAVGDLGNPTRTGYNFVKWIDNDGAEVLADRVYKVDGNSTYYAEWDPVKVTINLDSNTGICAVDSIIATYDSALADLPIPTKVGYSFTGWYTTSAGGLKVEATDISKYLADTTLYAGWEVKKFNVTLDYADGVSDTYSFEIAYGDKLFRLPAPIREGYNFVGWYKDGTEYTTSTAFEQESDLELTAVWDIIKYNVNFDYALDDDSINEAYTVEYGNSIEPDGYDREGYDFAGWFDNKGNEVTMPFVPRKDTTLTAEWEKQRYSISFDADGGITSTKSIKVYYQDAYGNLPTPFRTGYDFNGWYRDDELVNNDTITLASNHTLVAEWTPKQYVIYYNALDGICDVGSDLITYEDSYGELPTAFKEGYNFAGWYTSEVGGIEVTADTVFTDTKDKTLYARFTEIVTKFNLVLGEEIITEYEFGPGDSFDNLPVPEREGYEFLGWYYDDTPITELDPNDLTEGDELEARWKAKEYKITFESDGGTDFSEVTIDYDGTIDNLPEPERPGYEFLGWYYGERLIEDGMQMTWAEDIQLVAKWKAMTFVISFNATSGSCDIGDKEVRYDQYVGELPTPYRNGYDFVGWFTAEVGGNEVTPTTKYSEIEDCELFARWQAQEFYVTLDSAGGKCDTKQIKVKYGDLFGDLPNATRKGYLFKGWYTKKAGGTKVGSNTLVKLVMNNTLYAQWKLVTVATAHVPKVSPAKKKAVVTYKKVSNAMGYQVAISTSSKFKKSKTKLIVVGNRTKYVAKNLKCKTVYYARVRAYSIDSTGKKIYGKWSPVRRFKTK